MMNDSRRQLIIALKEVNEYDLLAKQLNDLLLADWNDLTKQALKDALTEMHKKEAANVTQQELNDSIDYIGQIINKDLKDATAEDVRMIVEETYTLSQQSILKMSPTFNLTDTKAMEWLYETNMYWIGEHYDGAVVDRLKKAGTDVIEQGLGRDEAIKLFEQTFKDQFAKSESYWSGLSNHIVTTSREFGAVEAYVKAEITEYRIDAVMDTRTTDICAYLNGTVYEVKKAVELRDALVSSTTPENAKNIKKWIPYTEGKDTPPDKDKFDFLFPPYHFNCRTRTVAL